MYNPFAAWKVTGTWAEHASYSLGGIDQGLNYGTPLPAPASGTLRTSGGSGEFKAGWVGSAGRRSILMLDEAIRGLVAIVFQHQSDFGPEGHCDERTICGWSGASAYGLNWGGMVHLHSHGLLADGTRVNWYDYIALAPSAFAGSGTLLTITPKDRTQDMETIRRDTGDIFNIAPLYIKHLNSQGQADISAAVQYENDQPHGLNSVQFAEMIDGYAIPHSHVYGLGDVPVGHVWSAQHDIRAAQVELDRKLDLILAK